MMLSIPGYDFGFGFESVSPTLSLSLSSLGWTLVPILFTILLAYYFPFYRYLSTRKRDWSPSSNIEPSDASLKLNHTNGHSGDDVAHITVSKILIHPIKSCRGSSVLSARYTPQGLDNDREWCIVDADTKIVVTARDVSKMVLITPNIIDDKMIVSFPEGSGCEMFTVPLNPSEETLRTWTIVDGITVWKSGLNGYVGESIPSERSRPSPSIILSQYMSRPVLLIYKGPRPRYCNPTEAFPKLDATHNYQDGYPLLVMSDESMDVLGEEIKSHVGTQMIGEEWREGKLLIERFRPNIVVHGAGPFAEDMWEEIVIASPSSNQLTLNSVPGITLVSKCTRCLLPNVDTQTGVRDAAVPYKVLMKVRVGLDPQNKWKPCVGCNGVPKGEGTIAVGDVVTVRKRVL